jgi:hypothetical protein
MRRTAVDQDIRASPFAGNFSSPADVVFHLSFPFNVS